MSCVEKQNDWKILYMLKKSSGFFYMQKLFCGALRWYSKKSMMKDIQNIQKVSSKLFISWKNVCVHFCACISNDCWITTNIQNKNPL